MNELMYFHVFPIENSWIFQLVMLVFRWNFHVGILQVDSIPKLESQSADFFFFFAGRISGISISPIQELEIH